MFYIQHHISLISIPCKSILGYRQIILNNNNIFAKFILTVAYNDNVLYIVVYSARLKPMLLTLLLIFLTYKFLKGLHFYLSKRV